MVRCERARHSGDGDRLVAMVAAAAMGELPEGYRAALEAHAELQPGVRARVAAANVVRAVQVRRYGNERCAPKMSKRKQNRTESKRNEQNNEHVLQELIGRLHLPTSRKSAH